MHRVFFLKYLVPNCEYRVKDALHRYRELNIVAADFLDRLSVPARIIASNGRTAEEAKKMAKEAMGGYVESLRKHGESLAP
jgi:hypothetical protein